MFRLCFRLCLEETLQDSCKMMLNTSKPQPTGQLAKHPPRLDDKNADKQISALSCSMLFSPASGCSTFDEEIQAAKCKWVLSVTSERVLADYNLCFFSIFSSKDSLPQATDPNLSKHQKRQDNFHLPTVPSNTRLPFGKMDQKGGNQKVKRLALGK